MHIFYFVTTYYKTTFVTQTLSTYRTIGLNRALSCYQVYRVTNYLREVNATKMHAYIQNKIGP